MSIDGLKTPFRDQSSEFAGEHHELIKAIEDRDEDRAEKLAHLHTVQVSDRFLSSLGVRHTSDMSISIDERV